MNFFSYREQHGILWWIFIGSWIWIIWMYVLFFYGIWWLINRFAGEEAGRMAKIIVPIVAAVVLVIGYLSLSYGKDEPKPAVTTAETTTAETTETTETSTTVETTAENITVAPETSVPTDTTETTTFATTVITTTTTTITTTPEPVITEAPQITYILNTNTMKFHHDGCRHVKDIQPQNLGNFTGNRDDLIAQGYSACGVCHP